MGWYFANTGWPVFSPLSVKTSNKIIMLSTWCKNIKKTGLKMMVGFTILHPSIRKTCINWSINQAGHLGEGRVDKLERQSSLG